MELDLNAIVAKAKPTTLDPIRRGREAEPNPFHDLVMQTYVAKEGQELSIPNGEKSAESGKDLNITKVTTLLRNAARDQGIGISIQVAEPGAKNTIVKFQGIEKRAYTPRKDSTENSTVGTDSNLVVAS